MPAPKSLKILKDSEIARIDKIKRTAIIAMFSDDELMDVFVLKGGSALDLVLQVNGRASIDIDLSIADELPFPQDEVLERIARNLGRAFEPMGYHVFDVTMEAVPPKLSPEFAGFWGGYQLHFKLIETDKVTRLKGDVVEMRRNAILIGNKGRFKIDISKHEYTVGKAKAEIEGYTIYVYTPEMMVAEKLRSICQQTVTYTQIVHSHRAQRSRDLVDIHGLIGHFHIDICAPENVELVRAMFDAKRVPLKLLGELEGEREFHRTDFASVVNTIRPDVHLEPYDYYFDFLVEISKGLEALWNK